MESRRRHGPVLQTINTAALFEVTNTDKIFKTRTRKDEWTTKGWIKKRKIYFKKGI